MGSPNGQCCNARSSHSNNNFSPCCHILLSYFDARRLAKYLRCEDFDVGRGPELPGVLVFIKMMAVVP